LPVCAKEVLGTQAQWTGRKLFDMGGDYCVVPCTRNCKKSLQREIQVTDSLNTPRFVIGPPPGESACKTVTSPRRKNKPKQSAAALEKSAG